MFLSRCPPWQENSICVYYFSTWEKRGGLSRTDVLQSVNSGDTAKRKHSVSFTNAREGRKKAFLLQNGREGFVEMLILSFMTGG